MALPSMDGSGVIVDTAHARNTQNTNSGFVGDIVRPVLQLFAWQCSETEDNDTLCVYHRTAGGKREDYAIIQIG